MNVYITTDLIELILTTNAISPEDPVLSLLAGADVIWRIRSSVPSSSWMRCCSWSISTSRCRISNSSDWNWSSNLTWTSRKWFWMTFLMPIKTSPKNSCSSIEPKLLPKENRFAIRKGEKIQTIPSVSRKNSMTQPIKKKTKKEILIKKVFLSKSKQSNPK